MNKILSKKDYYLLYKKYEHPPSTLFHKYISKNGARFFTFYFIKFGISPNILSVFSLLLVLSAVFILNFNISQLSKILLLLLLQISYIIDCADGVVARMTNKTSQFGAFLDLTLDRINHFVLFTGVGYYLFTKTDYSNYPSKYVLFFIICVLLYLIYPLNMTVLTQIYPDLKGYFKKNKTISDGLIKRIIKILYEFIDTGIMYFMISISIFTGSLFYCTIFYGIIGFILTSALYIMLYLREREIIVDKK